MGNILEWLWPERAEKKACAERDMKSLKRARRRLFGAMVAANLQFDREHPAERKDRDDDH